MSSPLPARPVRRAKPPAAYLAVACAVVLVCAAPAQEVRIALDLASVDVVCMDAVVVSHETNEILFDVIDKFHEELIEQFVRLVRRQTDVTFGYYGPKDPPPLYLAPGFSWDKRYSDCDAHLEMKGSISFHGDGRVSITSGIGLRRNELPAEQSLPNSDRGVLDLWGYGINTGSFEMSGARREAHSQALSAASEFIRAKQRSPTSSHEQGRP